MKLTKPFIGRSAKIMAQQLSAALDPDVLDPEAVPDVNHLPSEDDLKVVLICLVSLFLERVDGIVADTDCVSHPDGSIDSRLKIAIERLACQEGII